MSLVVNTNIASLAAQRNFSINTLNVNKSLERLSSGYKINGAADDAAGLSISEKMRTQIRGIGAAINNAQDGINLLSVAEGGYQVITENLQRIRELAVQGANDTNGSIERRAIAREVTARLQDIDRIASSLTFNTINLLSGSASATVAKLQIGPNDTAAANVLTIGSALKRASSTALSVVVNSNFASITANAGGIFNSGGNIRNFLLNIDTAISTVNTRRSLIGAYQNRLDSAIQSLSIQKENLQASDSRIRDLDIAQETANMTKNQVLQQASVSVLTQANQTSQLALSLLRG